MYNHPLFEVDGLWLVVLATFYSLVQCIDSFNQHMLFKPSSEKGNITSIYNSCFSSLQTSRLAKYALVDVSVTRWHHHCCCAFPSSVYHCLLLIYLHRQVKNSWVHFSHITELKCNSLQSETLSMIPYNHVFGRTWIPTEPNTVMNSFCVS